jgi:hypothetical protein
MEEDDVSGDSALQVVQYIFALYSPRVKLKTCKKEAAKRETSWAEKAFMKLRKRELSQR